MSLPFIDTHTHLYDEAFDTDRPEMLERARAAGAEALLLPNIDANSLGPMLAMHDQWPAFCYPMLGLHPTELPPDPTPLLDQMEHMLSLKHHPFVAVGEVGVDLYWDASRREEQMGVFRRQAEWSIRFQLPLVIHTRAAHAEVVEVLTPLRQELPGGIFHCFGGTAEEARELLDFPGFCLGIGGVVTFKKSSLPQVLATEVPLDRIVLETDAPYLAPTPYRGKRNEPAYMPQMIGKLAEIYQCSPEHISTTTTATARRLFKLPAPSA